VETERLSLWALCEGNPEGSSFTGDPEGYVEKALETGISLHRGPAGERGKGAHLPGTVERWMKGTLGLERLCLRELCEGDLVGDFIIGYPGRYVEKALETGITIGAPLGNLEGGLYTGDFER